MSTKKHAAEDTLLNICNIKTVTEDTLLNICVIKTVTEDTLLNIWVEKLYLYCNLNFAILQVKLNITNNYPLLSLIVYKNTYRILKNYTACV